MSSRPVQVSRVPAEPGRRSDVLEGGARHPVGLLSVGVALLAVLALLGSRPETGQDAWQELQRERTPDGQLVLAAHCTPSDPGCALRSAEQVVTVSAYGLRRPGGRVAVFLGLSNASPQPFQLLDVVLPAGLRREAAAGDTALPLPLPPSRAGTVPKGTSLSLVVAADCVTSEGPAALGPLSLLIGGRGTATTLTTSLEESGLPQLVVDACASGWRAS